MKKWFFALPVSLIAITLQVQALPASVQTAQATANTSAQADNTNAKSVQATQLEATLTKQVNSKHAKVGDKVQARTTNSATLANGMKLPRGTKLMGKVTEVQAKSRAHRTSHLAFAFDQAVLKNGQTVPIRAVITSVSVPSVMAAQGAEGGMGAGPADAGGMAGGGGPTAGLGGAVGGAAGGARGVVGGAGSAAENTAAQTDALADNTVNQTSRAGAMAGGVVSNGSSVSGPVAGLHGVTFSSSVHSSDSAAMSAKDENISLLSGTQMTMSVVAGDTEASNNGSAGGSASMHQ